MTSASLPPGSRSSSPADRYVPGAEGRGTELDRLTEEIRSCRRCPLGGLRTHAVVYRGGPSPRMVFVGEAPGAAEDVAGRPFVGRSGKILDAAIATLPVTGDEVGILNLLKCRPPGNRFDPVAARTCRPFLDRQLELLRPRVVVTLGAWALKAIDPGAPAILQAAGAPRPDRGRPAVFPLVHPAATMRSRRLRDRWLRDVAGLSTWLATGPA